MTIALLAATSGTALAAGPASGGAQPLRVEIDVSAIAEADAPHIVRFTRDRIGPLLEERSFIEAVEADDAITIRVDYVDAEDLEYAIYVDVYDDGEKVSPGIDWFMCKFCPQGMVADTIAEKLPAALDLLDQAEVSERVEVGNEPPQAEPRDGDELADERTRPIGWLGVTGALVGAGGLATTIAGAVRIGQGEVAESSQSSQQRVTDYRPQGLVLLGVGASALLLGSTALVVDLVMRKKRRERAALGPTSLPHGAGLSVSGRF